MFTDSSRSNLNFKNREKFYLQFARNKFYKTDEGDALYDTRLPTIRPAIKPAATVKLVYLFTPANSPHASHFVVSALIKSHFKGNLQEKYERVKAN